MLVSADMGRLTDGPLDAGSYTPAMSRAGTVLCPILVGRDDLLELIDHLTTEALADRGHALFLSGQAGLGKTRLIRAAIRKAEAAGLRVDGGAVAPQDRQVPLASIREMATGMRGNNAFGSLSQDLLAIDGRHDGDALGARRIIVRSTADRILEAIDRPTMLIFDDLHWTDELSLEVIGELARHAAGRPLFLLGGYRADEFPADTIHREWRARLLGQRHAEEARLRPLTFDETAIATTLILGGELPAPSDVVAAVHQRTNGIPLHIEELLAALDDDARADGWLIREAHVPDTIGDAVLARLSRLSDDALTVARAGAVIGRCFSPDVLTGIVGRPLRDLEPTLNELVDAAILYPFQYVDDGYYDFRHQLLRDAIYGSVPPSDLRRFHAQAAEFVTNLQASSIVHASRHYERAGLRSQAFKAALEAAREASRISARQEAYELYRRAIDNMPDDLPVEEQAALYDAFSDAANAIERNEECVTAATRARELYLEAGMPVKAATMLVNMSVDAARNGASNEEMRTYTERALAEIADLPATPDREQLRAWLLISRASDWLFVSDLSAARADAQAARELAEPLREREAVLETDLLLAQIDILEGRYESGLSDGMRAAREARDAGYESVGVTGYRNLAIMAARVMDARTAELAMREGLQYADAIEQSHCRQMMATTSSLLDWGAGHWEVADERARQELVERGCRRGVIGALDVIGLVALGRGRTDEARRWLDESLAAARRIDEVQLILTPLWALAETDLWAGDLPVRSRAARRPGDRQRGRRACASHPVRRDRHPYPHRGAPTGRRRTVGRPRPRVPRRLGIGRRRGAEPCRWARAAGWRIPFSGARGPRTCGSWLGRARAGLGIHGGEPRPGTVPRSGEPSRRCRGSAGQRHREGIGARERASPCPGRRVGKGKPRTLAGSGTVAAAHDSGVRGCAADRRRPDQRTRSPPSSRYRHGR